MKFRLTGEFKPYTRMTRRGMFISPAAQAYLASQERLAWQFIEQCNGSAMPAKTPLSVRICIQSPRPNHHSDLDNQAKALIDSAQQAGVIPNDMWVDSLQVRREFGKEFCVEFEVVPA